MPKIFLILAFGFLSIVVRAQETPTDFIKNGQLDKALEASDKGIKDKSIKKKPDTWLIRGDIFMALAKSTNEDYKKLSATPYKEAANCYKQAKELDEKKDISATITSAEKAMFKAAEKAFKAKNYLRTIELYEYCFSTSKLIDKPNKKVPYNLAKAAEKVKDYPKAILYYEKSIRLEYRSEMSYLSKSYMQYKNKEFDNAIQTLETAYEKHPHNEYVVSGYISALFQDGRYPEVDSLIVHHPDNVTLLTSIGSYYAHHPETYDKAIGILLYAVELEPSNFSAHNDLGMVYCIKAKALLTESKDNTEKANKFYEEAIHLLEKAYYLKPHSANTYRNLKESYIALGLKEKADALEK